MFSIPSNLYEVGGRCSSDSYEIAENEKLSPRSMAEAKAAAASNSHKEAERRRRKRINGHIATLKSILPNAIKTDKASLLGEAVRRVRELKKAASELSAIDDTTTTNNNPNNNNTSLIMNNLMMFPSETDELRVSRCEDDDSSTTTAGLIKATLCCEDRPEIVLDLISALKSVEAKVVRAEMSTVGGRTKSVLWVRFEEDDDDVGICSESDVCLGTLRRALKMVMDKSAFLPGSAQVLPGNKRPRYYHL